MSRCAYQQQDIVQLGDKKIECLCTWGSNLLLGNSDGSIQIYEVFQEYDNKRQYQLSNTKVLSKKAWTQIDIIPDIGILLGVSDGTLSVYSMPTFQLRFTIAKPKGFLFIAVNRNLSTTSSKTLPALAAAFKKKVVLYVWEHEMFEEFTSFTLQEAPKTMVLTGHILCVGNKKEYTIYNILSGSMQSICTTGGAKGSPISTVLPNDELLLSKDSVGFCVGLDGQPTRKNGLRWSDIPVQVAYCFPYVVTALPKSIEVMTVNTQRVVQSLPLKNVKSMCLDRAEENMFVATTNTVYRLVSVDLSDQVDELVRNKEFDESLLLCDYIPSSDDDSKAQKKRTIEAHYAHHLFSMQEFTRAMEFFNLSNVDPIQVIALFPKLIPKTLQKVLPTPPNTPKFDDDVTRVALRAAVKYLVAKRGQSYRSIGIDDRAAMDTFLLKAYLEIGGEDVEEFLRESNECNVDECEKLLVQHKKYNLLVLLYWSKGLHKKALDMLLQFGQREGEGEMSGVDGLVDYLKRLGRECGSLVLEYSKWVFEVAKEKGLEIFTSSQVEVEDQIPPHEVLSHLKKVAPSLSCHYLEHIITKENNTTPEFHNELVLLYLDKVLKLMKEAPTRKGERIAAGGEKGELGETRAALLNFLDSSSNYHPEKMLSKFPFNDMYEERAILLSKIGQHEQALSIYANKLGDHRLAEEYCIKHYNESNEESRDVFLSLLHVYLRPQPSPQGRQCPIQLEPALKLLAKHFSHINTPRALDLIPSETKLRNLLPFFESVLRHNHETHRNNQVIKHLRKAERRQVQEELIRWRARRVHITSDRMCPVCGKRIGNSVFACYPSGTVVHYVCSKDKNVDPVTGEKF